MAERTIIHDTTELITFKVIKSRMMNKFPTLAKQTYEKTS